MAHSGLLFEIRLFGNKISIRQRDDPIAECSSYFFQRLVASLTKESSASPSQKDRHSGLYLREIEPRYGEEERRTADEDVIVVLLDVGEGAGSSFGDANIDDEVASSSQTHDFTPQSHRQDLGAIEPGGAVEHTVVCDHEEVDAEDGKAFSDPVVTVLEFKLHDCGVNLDDNDTSQAGQDHLTSAPLIR